MARSAKPRKRKLAPQRSKLPRYVVKLHEDDFFDEEEVEILRFDNFDDTVECCADLNIPFFVDAGNKKLVFWFVRVDDEGHPEIARCTEREFTTILAGISAGGMYCPDCCHTKKVCFRCKKRSCPHCGVKAGAQWIQYLLSLVPDGPWQQLYSRFPASTGPWCSTTGGYWQR
ncbi:transposase [Escherichia coli O121:H19 str. 2010C-3840]|nr:hypothetical protein EC50959_3220 [Escherichia coli 5.0959]ETI80416.1 transposase TnpA [Escherichia coli ATCC BAA-2219]EYU79165.1 transposase [Escherichia coli O121:H19 str. 2010C-4254]EYV03214.1 transposase [Escherichia coli O121:H19 str. 2010C-3840]EYV04805.1 transposase [Escherichia coli O121:H19 str. 2010C-3609]EYV69659.1 transposase [Escherichia coli O121:H19 str. 2009C-4659]EYX94114.1 transposase [Escherichia coli O121:H19 str. 2011C-3537]EYX95032.1 transposase [Escherichia coli O12